MRAKDLSELSMLDLFRVEAESQAQALTSGLLALERNPRAAEQLESCMRAAHSIKGAARVVDIDTGVVLAHAMEDCFVAAQEGRITLHQEQIDVLLQGVDLLMSIAKAPDMEPGQPTGKIRPDVDLFVANLAHILTEQGTGTGAPERAGTEGVPAASSNKPVRIVPVPPMNGSLTASLAESRPGVPAVSAERETSDRVLRVTADNLNRLLGLAGESLVGSRWLKPFGDSLLRLKRLHRGSEKALETLREALSEQHVDERVHAAMAEAQRHVLQCQKFLSQRLVELEMSGRHSTNLAHRLYDEALACRMRPFADGVVGLPRMVRDVGRSLDKQVRLEIVGAATQVDRDVLEKLEAPLGHLLRNAVDHGIETPDERLIAGKPAEGVVCLEARHNAGSLQITVSDDGRGIDLNGLRERVVIRGLTNREIATTLSESELLEFLFLPNFTTKDVVTDISGRGVGLDAVQDMVKRVRGVVRISSQPGSGTRFVLQLPLTLSVVRTLLVDIGGEPYAFPLAYIVRAMKLSREKIEMIEGRQHFSFDGRQIALVTAHQILESAEPKVNGDELSVVIVSDQKNMYGLVVDGFLGEKELVVQPLDARLGKVKDISAGALMENGSPVLIVDVEDMICSMEKLAYSDRLNKVRSDVAETDEGRRKRILVVDDSLTVRELQRKILDHNGYEIEVAVDGVDGWNAVRTGRFDLVITDIDMPRMDGIELVALIKKNPNLKSLPVMIVSYKDREEDRRRGLDAGADYYLSKGNFHDEGLTHAVVDLIGEATE
ncbi:MAG: hybrid sensor histidine kinase/response regulator [Pseudomonadota bacterium]